MPVPDSTPLTPRQRTAAGRLLAAVSPAADELGALFARQGHELALVGGSVRDVFLGRAPSGDLDLTTDAVPARVLEIISGWADQHWTIGIEFGTVGMVKDGRVFEITTYRSERYGRGSRKPEVAYGESLTDDLSRRDFTVNAMAARLPGHELVDPFGGLRDLQGRLLRTPGSPQDSLRDDPLRMLRAARFVAQLGFTVAAELRQAMTGLAPLVRPPKVSVERITAELTKLMLSPLEGGPSQGIALLVDTGVADQVLPEVPQLRLEQDEHYRHKDVYQHSLTVLDRAIALEERYDLKQDLRLRLAALLHDIGKPKTRSRLPGGRVAFHHHEVKGAKMARARLTALRFPASVVADVSRLVELHPSGTRGRCSPGCTRSPGRTAPPGTRPRRSGWLGPTTAWRSGSRYWPSGRSWRASGPTWTGTTSCGSSASGRARWSARRTRICSSCAWSTARSARGAPLRSCGPGPPTKGSWSLARRGPRRPAADGWTASTRPR